MRALLSLFVEAQGSVIDTVEAELGNHSIALPFGHLGRTVPLHPAVQLGVEHLWVDRGPFVLASAGRAAIFRQGLVGSSAALETALVARLTAGAGPTLEADLALGLSSAWRGRPVLVWDDQSGSYLPAKDLGRLGMIAGFGLGAGYDLAAISDLPVAVLVHYRWFVQSPFLPALPLGPQGIVSLRVRLTLGGAR